MFIIITLQKYKYYKGSAAKFELFGVGNFSLVNGTFIFL